ncbi:unknown [Sutterella sp. CAG:351]|nr:unknown [Sutterella sp. CAG:351]
MRSAAETLEELLILVNGKGSCFLMVERTKSKPVDPLLLQAHIRGNDIDNIHPIQEVFDKRLRNHHGSFENSAKV